MSKTIDSKVVEMRFDNKHFENNVKESMSTLDKLKQKLNFTGASKGLENLNSSANKVNMSGMSGALDTVHAKFSALEVMGVTALANITNSAVNAGKRMVSALTIDPVKTGLSEYETQINAIQTILSNTRAEGTNVEIVNDALDELNRYADKTIYNFTEMTRNIGTFTAAGVKLDTSVSAIKGIANLAAVSGSTSQQASTAMYQLSQALAAGRVSLMDWNSVVNAGMGGKLFQDALVRTSELLGTGAEQAIKTYGSFRESLTKGEWLTTEVLTETLKQLSGAYSEADLIAQGFTEAQAKEIAALAKDAEDAATKVKTFTQLWDVLKESAQSGWAQTWRLIIGDFEQARNLFSPLAKFLTGIIEGFSTARNKLLEGALGKSFTGLLDKIKTSADGVKKVVDTVKDYGKVVDEIIGGKWGNGQARWDKLAKAGYDWAHAQNLVNEKLGNSLRRTTQYKEGQKEATKTQEKLTETTTDYLVSLAGLSDAELEAALGGKEQAKAFRELEKAADKTGIPLKEFIENIDEIDGRYLLINSFKNLGLSLVSVFKSIGAAWRNAFPPMSEDTLFNIIAGFHKFSTILRGRVEENADELTRTLQGLFAILDLITMVIGGGFKIAFTILKTILGAFNMDILDFTAMIGDAIVAVRDWIEDNNLLVKGIKIIVEYVKMAVDAIGKWIANNETITKGITKVKDSLKSFTKGIQSWFDGLKETDNIPKYILSGLANGLKAGASAVYEAIISIGKGLLDAICKVLGIHSPSTEFFEIGSNVILGLFNGLKSGVSMIWEFIKGLGTKMVEILGGIDFGKLLAAGIGLGILIVTIKLLNAINNIMSPLEGLGDMFEGIGDGVRSFGQGVKKWGQAKLVESIAKSIAILAASVILLAQLDPGTLWATIGAIAALGVIIGALMLIASKAKNMGDMGKLSVSFLGLTSALFIMALALKTMGKMSADQMNIAINGLVAMILGLVAIIASFSLLNTGKGIEHIDKVGKAIKKISTALLILLIVIKLASMLKPEDLAKGLIVIGVLGYFVVALIAVSALAGEHAQKAGKMISKIAWALLIMVGVIKLASMMSAEELTKGLIVIGALGIFVAALIAVSYFAGEHAAKAGAMLLMTSIALAIVVGVIKSAAKLSEKELIKGGAVLAALGVFFTALIAVSHFAGENAMKAGAMLLMVAAALAILVGILFVVSKMNMKEIYPALGVITVLELLIGGLIYVSQYAEKVDWKTLAVIIAGIVLLVGSLIALTFIDAEKLKTATASLSAVLLSLAGVLASTKLMKDTKISWKSLGQVVLIVGILAGIAILLGEIKNPTAAIAGAIGLSILMGTLAGVMFAVNKMGKLTGKALLGIVGLVALCVPLYILVDILKRMNGIDNVTENATALALFIGALAVIQLLCAASGAIYSATGGLAAAGILGLVAIIVSLYTVIDILRTISKVENAIGNLKALSDFMILMTKILVVLAIVGPLALIGVVAMDALIILMGVIAVFAVAIGALMTEVPELEAFLNKGLPILVQLAGAIGEMIGAFIEGALTKIASGLPEIGTHLSNFMNNCKGFIQGAKTVDEKVLAGVGILTAAIIALSAANIIEGITSFLTFGTSFEELGTHLSNFMINALPFIATAMTINPNVLETVKTLASAIMTLTAANLVEGITRFLGGGSSLEKFGSQLGYLGTGLNDFIAKIGPITPEQVESAKNAAGVIKTLAEAAKAIPNAGGLLADLVGENDMKTWSEQLPYVADGIIRFTNAIINSKISDDAVKTAKLAADVIKVLADASNKIPNTGGALAKLVGDNNLKDFADQFPYVGDGIVGFVQAITNGEIEDDAVGTAKLAAEVIGVLADVADELPDDGGLWGKIVGDKTSLQEFSSQFPQVGEGIAGFATNIGTFSDKKLASVNAAIRALELISKLGNINLAAVEEHLEGFGDKLINFGKDVKLFTDELAKISVEAMETAVNRINELITLIVDVIASNQEAIKTFGDSLKNLGLAGIKGFISAFTDASLEGVKTAAAKLANTFVSGVESKKEDITRSFVTMATAAVTGLTSDTVKTNVSTAGASIASGFATGITSKTSIAKVTAAGTSIGNYAIAAAKAAIDSNSPSKEAMKIGNFFGDGFAIGIEDYGSAVYKSSYGVAEMAKTGLSNAVSSIANFINNDMDTQPTIRPVLDLSDIESGAGYLNSMFNDPSVGVISNLNAISNGMNDRNQNGVNGDVVSAINKLRKELGNVNSTTNNYNVNGVTYDDGSNITDAVRTLVRAAKIERRV